MTSPSFLQSGCSHTSPHTPKHNGFGSHKERNNPTNMIPLVGRIRGGKIGEMSQE